MLIFRYTARTLPSTLNNNVNEKPKQNWYTIVVGEREDNGGQRVYSLKGFVVTFSAQVGKGEWDVILAAATIARLGRSDGDNFLKGKIWNKIDRAGYWLMVKTNGQAIHYLESVHRLNNGLVAERLYSFNALTKSKGFTNTTIRIMINVRSMTVGDKCRCKRNRKEP